MSTNSLVYNLNYIFIKNILPLILRFQNAPVLSRKHILAIFKTVTCGDQLFLWRPIIYTRDICPKVGTLRGRLSKGALPVFTQGHPRLKENHGNAKGLGRRAHVLQRYTYV